MQNIPRSAVYLGVLNGANHKYLTAIGLDLQTLTFWGNQGFSTNPPPKKVKLFAAGSTATKNREVFSSAQDLTLQFVSWLLSPKSGWGLDKACPKKTLLESSSTHDAILGVHAFWSHGSSEI